MVKEHNTGSTSGGDHSSFQVQQDQSCTDSKNPSVRKFFAEDFWSQTVSSERSAGIAVFFIILGFICFQLWFGAQFHYIEECYSAEYDRYVENADQLREGTIPRDPYHPLLYPILAAGLGHAIDDTFAAARIISSCAGGLVLFLAYMLAVQCFGWQTAVGATLWLMCNSIFFLFCFMTSTDMLFAAFALSCLYWSIRVSESAAIRPAVFMGICFALAYFTRYAAVALIPIVLLGLWCSPLISISQRIRRFLFVTVVIVTTLIPHFALNTYVFHSPFYNENSKNLARRAGIDLERNQSSAPHKSVAKIMLHSPGSVTQAAVSNADRWIVQGALSYVAGNKQFVAAAVFMASLLFGMYLIVVRKERKKLLLLAYSIIYFAMICVFIEPFARLLLPILPVLLMVAVSFFFEIALAGKFHVKNLSIPTYVPPFIIVLALVASAVPSAISDSAQRHPYQELEAAKALEEREGSGIVVMGSFPFMQRYVKYQYQHLIDDASFSREKYYERLHKTVREKRANFLIFGKPSLGKRPQELLQGRALPSFLKPVAIGEQVAVYQVIPDTP